MNYKHVLAKRLYGYKLGIKSYVLRVYLLQLLFQSANHCNANYLTGTVLAFCLLKMYSKFQEDWFNVSNVNYYHPIIMQNSIEVLDFPKGSLNMTVKLNQIVKAFGKKPPFDDMSLMSLMNNSKGDDTFEAKLYFV